ncbi:helix-turn-helix domain-containing protein [Actinokineospora fastidiosa]|nr:helix-turn-helix transcriptional regulator [Actinokineospora fastidiosa]
MARIALARPADTVELTRGDQVCAECEQEGEMRAPLRPRDFWIAPPLAHAFADRDMGALVRAYRYHPVHGHRALSQETVARWLGISQSQLSRVESGRNRVDTLSKLVHYARVLRIPADLLWFDLPEEAPRFPREGEVVALPGGPLVPAASSSTSSLLADSLLRALDLHAVTDNLAGPRALLALIPHQRRYVEERLSSARGADRAALLRVAARYAEFEGWVYQDSGALDDAMRSSHEASDYAREVGDASLSSYILMRRSNIAGEAGRHQLALRLAESALAYSDRISPTLRALALRQQAHVHARRRDAGSCERALAVAFDLAERAPEPSGALGSYCTPAYLQMEAADCWIELGRPEVAIGALRGSLARWEPQYRRDLGVCLARLSLAHAAGSQPEHAVEVARSCVALAAETRSHRVIALLTRVGDRLRTMRAGEHIRTMETLLRPLRLGTGERGVHDHHGDVRR